MRLENTSIHRSSKRSSNRFRLSRLLGIGAVVSWITVIAVLLGTPDPPIPGGGDSGARSQISLQLGHLFLFAVLGMLTVLAALAGGWTRRLAVALTAGLLLGIAVGVLTEVYQLGVSGRSGNLEDVTTNIVGAAVGALLTCLAFAGLVRRPASSRSS